jgi:hypothetical protein
MEPKSFNVKADLGLLLVSSARQKLVRNWHIASAISTITDAIEGIPISLAIDILIGNVALTFDDQRKQLTVCDIEGHPEFQLDDEIAKLLPSKVISFSDFYGLITMKKP